MTTIHTHTSTYIQDFVSSCYNYLTFAETFFLAALVCSQLQYSRLLGFKFVMYYFYNSSFAQFLVRTPSELLNVTTLAVLPHLPASFVLTVSTQHFQAFKIFLLFAVNYLNYLYIGALTGQNYILELSFLKLNLCVCRRRMALPSILKRSYIS